MSGTCKEKTYATVRLAKAMGNLALLVIATLWPLGIQAENVNFSSTPDSYVNGLIASAEHGDVQAQTCLGEMYREGTMVNGDSVKAAFWFKQAADKGDTKGKYLLALTKIAGMQIQTETFQEYQEGNRATAFVQELASQGYAPAEAHLGLAYLFKDDYVKALAYLKKAGNQNDPLASVTLGFIYKYGFGIDPTATIAKQWFARAASYRVDCAGDYAPLIYSLIAANVSYPHDVINAKIQGRVLLRVTYRAGKAVSAALYKPAKINELNVAALSAAQNLSYPQWSPLLKLPEENVVIPVDFTQQNPYLALLVTRDSQYRSFRDEVRYAIQQNTVFPKHVLVHGTSGTGNVTLAFVYRDGRVSNVRIERSANDKYEDDAGITAVKTARYPPPPTQYAGKNVHCMVAIEYEMSPEATVVSQVILR